MLRQRKQIRLKKYDYSQSGYYYVTICTQNRECLFGDLDEFQIMPNHIHFILRIISGASRRAPTIQTPRTLGFIVGIFKTECTIQINKLRNTPGQKIFQRNYYEHIIRNETALIKIREYKK